jgi:hypothetical protein
VRLVLAERFGKELPAFDGYDNHRDLGSLAAYVGEGKALLGLPRIDRPVEGAIVLMFLHSRPLHIGICVDSKSVLHVERGCDSVVQRLSDIAHRIEGFYEV